MSEIKQVVSEFEGITQFRYKLKNIFYKLRNIFYKLKNLYS